MSKKIALKEIHTDEVFVHAEFRHLSYATICGNSEDDSEFEVVKLRRDAKINCRACKHIIEAARDYNSRDLE